MMFWYGHGTGLWAGAGMMLSMVLFWVVLVIGIVALLQHLLAAGREMPIRGANTDAAERILAEKFAHGEINEEQYRGRIAVLHDPN